MSASGGISQLLKGIFIGVVLIMAIIGTMTVLDKDNPLSSILNSDEDKTLTPETNIINSPSITLNPDNTKPIDQSSDSSNITDLNATLIEDTEPAITEQNTQINKPILENERAVENTITEDSTAIKFGMMELNALNPKNNQSLKANYSVFDKNNIKVAESQDSTSASYRLPIGQYKVETTLVRTDEVTKQKVPILTKSRYIIVRNNTTSSQTFELEPPTSTGVLQVSANINNRNVRANFVVQKANGEVVASRNNVTNSLFKLDAGSYKVTVNSGQSKDFKSVEIKSGESLQTVFDLKEVATQGKLLVRVFDTRSSTPVRADIKISAVNGTIIQDLKSTTQTELSLVSGNYKISVIGPNGTSNKNIRVNPGQNISEVFRFDVPNNPTANPSNQNTTQINENVTIKPIGDQSTVAVDTTNTKAVLNVKAQDKNTQKPIKSNIYIQTLDGKHLDKKTYVDSASFNLDPGVYKVTVRAKNRQNNVKNIRISKNKNINETFLMVNPNAVQTNNKQTTQATQATIPPSNSANKQKVINTGFLNIAMQASNNQQRNNTDLRSHFIVSTLAGKKIVELTSVQVGNFKLDVGSYMVTAIHKNKRQQRRVNVRPNQNTRLTFKTSDFSAPKGILRSQIVNESGRPLKGNLSVINTAGQVVARANNVSSAVFNLPPERHTVRVNFQGLSGSEVINITPNETTVQTFTIAPNSSQNNNAQQQNNSRDIKDILKEKIKKELQRTF